MKTKLSLQDLKQDIDKHSEKLTNEKRISVKTKNGWKILRGLLNQIERVDFREKASIGENNKILKKVYVVLIIEEIFEIAKQNNWGLCVKDSFIYGYNGQYWQVIEASDFKIFLAEAAVKMGVNILDAKYHLFKDELYKQFISSANLPTPEPTLQVLINVLNGTFSIDPDKQELRGFLKEDFLKYQLPFEFDPKAKAPLFKSFLDRVLPDKASQAVLAEYIAYIFTNHLKLEKVLLLFGTGANGKSVFFEIINALLGEENVSSYSLHKLTKDDNYQLAELTNRLLNYSSEINGKLEPETFKKLVSGEPIPARRIYGEPFTMRNYAKLMFNCNELPKEIEQTNAFFRRFIIIPFLVTIPEAEQDVELANKIIENELSGVFNWVMDGLKRLLRQKKFTYSALIEKQVSDFKKESDSVSLFIDEENYQPSVDEWISLKEIFNQYVFFCTAYRLRPCSCRTFSERLRNLGYETIKKNFGKVVYAKK